MQTKQNAFDQNKNQAQHGLRPTQKKQSIFFSMFVTPVIKDVQITLTDTNFYHIFKICNCI